MEEIRERTPYRNLYFESKGVPPLEKHLFLPWNGSLATIPSSWAEVLEAKRKLSPGSRSLLSDVLVYSKAASMAELTLMPAPGEQFWIDIQCVDQLLNKVETAVFAKVMLGFICKLRSFDLSRHIPD